MSIWMHGNLAGKIKPENRLTQDEGSTPVEETALEIDGRQILLKFKREDTNPNGSFKDRSLAFQVSHYKQKGAKELVISSTGNAAISAAAYCKQAGIDLHVFVSDKIEESKMKRLKMVSQIGDVNVPDRSESKVTIHKSRKPKSDAIKFANQHNLINLRGSVDDIALEGFKTLGYEIAKISDLVDSIFIPCSSGTSTYGMYLGLEEAGEKNSVLPQIHVVQTSKVHPIAVFYDRHFEHEKQHPADAITDRVANRLQQVHHAIEKTDGFGWVISSKELDETKSILAKEGFEFSNTAALSVAGVIKSLRSGRLTEKPLAVISGL